MDLNRTYQMIDGLPIPDQLEMMDQELFRDCEEQKLLKALADYLSSPKGEVEQARLRYFLRNRTYGWQSGSSGTVSNVVGRCIALGTLRDLPEFITLQDDGVGERGNWQESVVESRAEDGLDLQVRIIYESRKLNTSGGWSDLSRQRETPLATEYIAVTWHFVLDPQMLEKRLRFLDQKIKQDSEIKHHLEDLVEKQFDEKVLLPTD